MAQSTEFASCPELFDARGTPPVGQLADDP
jgi:hypothetical protein